jgi:hypothetical protein
MVFCTLCWRTPNTKYFCKEHLGSGETRKLQQKHKRRTLAELKKRGIYIDNKLEKSKYYSRLYNSLYKMSYPPSFVLKKISYPLVGVESLARMILNITSLYYPLSFTRLKNIDFSMVKNKYEFSDSIVKALEPRSGNSNIKAYFINPTFNLDDEVWVPILIEMLARYEAFMNINEKEIRPGPPKKTNEDKEIRRNLADRIYELNANNTPYTLKQLSIEFHLSMARISVLRKELINKNSIT